MLTTTWTVEQPRLFTFCHCTRLDVTCRLAVVQKNGSVVEYIDSVKHHVANGQHPTVHVACELLTIGNMCGCRTFRYFCHVWRPKRSNFTNTRGVTCNACFTSVALLIRSNIFPTQTWILSDVSGVELNKVLRTSFSAKPRHSFPMLCYQVVTTTFLWDPGNDIVIISLTKKVFVLMTLT